MVKSCGGAYGSSTGTFMVKDIEAGSGDSGPAQLTNVGGILYFTATNWDLNGEELWRSDGTSAGTFMVRDIRSGANSSFPSQLTNVGGILYFEASDGISGYELWRSDGTSTGTYMVKNIRPGANGSSPSRLTNVGGTLYFRANDGANGHELWRSDGTSIGTMLVKDIQPGSVGSYPSTLTNINGTLYFSTMDEDANRFSLWKSNGTSADTLLVKQFEQPHRLEWMANAEGTLYFSRFGHFASTGGNGIEWWKSDGTPSGTVLINGFRHGLMDYFDGSVAVVGGTVYLQGGNHQTGRELWQSDGTPTGTSVVNDIWRGNDSSIEVVSYDSLFAFPRFHSFTQTENNDLYFIANDGGTGHELWRTRGDSTTLVADLSNSSIAELGSYPVNFSEVDGKLFFVTHGVELALISGDQQFHGGLWMLDTNGFGVPTLLATGAQVYTPMVNLNGTLSL